LNEVKIMAISRKPKTVDEFINAGGGVPAAEVKPAPKPKTEDEMTPVTLRVPADILADVDASAKQRRPRCSRNSWILEAMIEKLEREEKE
jgi:hypothetical protein